MTNPIIQKETEQKEQASVQSDKICLNCGNSTHREIAKYCVRCGAKLSID